MIAIANKMQSIVVTKFKCIFCNVMALAMPYPLLCCGDRQYQYLITYNQLWENFCLQSGSSDLFFLHLKSPVFSSRRYY